MGTLYYDADCGFCTASARALRRLGGPGDVAPLQSVDLGSLGVDPQRATQEVPHVDDAGRVRYGAPAIAAALSETGRPWRWWGALLAAAPAQVLARPVYAFVARHRHRLPGGTAACRLP